MKHIFRLMIAGALVLPVVKANAQTADSSKHVSAVAPAESYVTLKAGKVVEFNNGSESALSTPYVCANGNKVATDGTVTNADGTTSKLEEGERIYKDGHKVGSAKK